MRLRWLIALPLLIIPSKSGAQDIFVVPPVDVRTLAHEMDLDSNIMTLATQDIQHFCGDNYGCLAPDRGDELCRVYIWIGLPEFMQKLATKNLMAQCTGWVPPE